MVFWLHFRETLVFVILMGRNKKTVREIKWGKTCSFISFLMCAKYSHHF